MLAKKNVWNSDRGVGILLMVGITAKVVDAQFLTMFLIVVYCIEEQVIVDGALVIMVSTLMYTIKLTLHFDVGTKNELC